MADMAACQAAAPAATCTDVCTQHAHAHARARAARAPPTCCTMASSRSDTSDAAPSAYLRGSSAGRAVRAGIECDLPCLPAAPPLQQHAPCFGAVAAHCARVQVAGREDVGDGVGRAEGDGVGAGLLREGGGGTGTGMQAGWLCVWGMVQRCAANGRRLHACTAPSRGAAAGQGAPRLRAVHTQATPAPPPLTAGPFPWPCAALPHAHCPALRLLGSAPGSACDCDCVRPGPSPQVGADEELSRGATGATPSSMVPRMWRPPGLLPSLLLCALPATALAALVSAGAAEWLGKCPARGGARAVAGMARGCEAGGAPAKPCCAAGCLRACCWCSHCCA